MLNVVCIKSGEKYSPEYVNHLARAVRRYLLVPHRFVCLTDDPQGVDDDVEMMPLVEDLPGWWNKIALFKSTIHDLQGTLLYFDLDMVIIRSINGFATYEGQLVAMPTFRRAGEYGSALMRFEIGQHQRVWDLFVPRARDVIREVQGDQNWINACCTTTSEHESTRKVRQLWPDVTPERSVIAPYPRSWLPDFKGELQNGLSRLGSDAKVIVFHGRPMVHEVEWVARLWRGEAQVSEGGDALERFAYC
jgi:hypothetical protein